MKWAFLNRYLRYTLCGRLVGGLEPDTKHGHVFDCAMRYALCATRLVRLIMPAIAPIEDLRAAQEELLAANDLEELKRVFKKWRRIGWKNICRLWLEESTPEKLKGEGR